MRLTKKASALFKAHKVFFAICLLLPLYHFVIINHANAFHVNEVTYAFHTLDYSMGFCSRVLPGALYHLLVGVYNKEALDIYLTVLYLAFVVLLSLFTERFIKTFFGNAKEIFVLVLLFLTGPFTFAMIVQEFGMIDFYWILFFFLSCLLLYNKYLRFFVPVLVALMVITHYGSMVCYVPALLLIILICLLKTEEKKERRAYLLIFSVSLFIGAALTLYFMVHDTGNLHYSLREFNSIVRDQRGAFPDYYDFYFYKYIEKDSPYYYQLNEVDSISLNGLSIGALFEILINQIKSAFSFETERRLLAVNVLALVPQAFLIYIICSRMRNTEKRLEKLLLFLMIALMLVVEATGVVLSTDNTRWLYNSMIVLFVFVFYVLRFDHKEGIKTIQNLFSKLGDGFIYLILIIYSCLFFDPYTL